VISGKPWDEVGGIPETPKTGLAFVVLDVWLAGATAAPLPWVYCRWVLTHVCDGSADGVISRTPMSTGLKAPPSA